MACTIVSVRPTFRSPKWRPFRAGIFVAMGLSAVFPVIHGVLMYGLIQMNSRIGLPWLMLQGALYIIGAGFYAVCILSIFQPQCLQTNAILGSIAWAVATGKLWCLGEFTSDIPCVDTLRGDVTSYRLIDGLWPRKESDGLLTYEDHYACAPSGPAFLDEWWKTLNNSTMRKLIHQTYHAVKQKPLARLCVRARIRPSKWPCSLEVPMTGAISQATKVANAQSG